MEGKTNRLKKVINIIFYLCILVIIVFSISNIVAAKKGKQPSILGYSIFYIMTGSMEPTIPQGSLVIDKTGSKGNIQKGDVITFKENSNITTHRVYKVLDNGERFVTKGDANNATDPVIRDRKNVLGVVKFHIPYVGDVIQFIKNNIFIIATILIIAFMGINSIFKQNVNKSK